MHRLVIILVSAALLGCAGTRVTFVNADPEERLDIPGVLYRPEGAGPFPAVVLLHGCHGVLPSTHDWGRWFEERGYVALVVDSWGPRGIPSGLRKGCRADEPDLPPRERFADALGALRFLQARPDVEGARVGLVGWSNGGAFAIRVIARERLTRAREMGAHMPDPTYRASVALYPGGCATSVKDTPTVPLLVLIGGADDWTVASSCEAMVEAMRRRDADASIVVYPGAYHYFDVEGQGKTFLFDVGNDNRPDGAGATVAYDHAAATDARRRVAEFFAQNLGRR